MRRWPMARPIETFPALPILASMRFPVSRITMRAMIYKLGMSAEKRWRRIQGFDYLAKVIEGVKFEDGIEVSSETEDSRSAA